MLRYHIKLASTIELEMFYKKNESGVVRQMLQPQNYDTDCCSESGTKVLTTTMNEITQRDTKIFTWFGEKKFSYIHG